MVVEFIHNPKMSTAKNFRSESFITLMIVSINIAWVYSVEGCLLNHWKLPAIVHLTSMDCWHWVSAVSGNLTPLRVMPACVLLWTLLPCTSQFEFLSRIQMDSEFFRLLQQIFKDPYTVVHGPIMDAAFSHLTIWILNSRATSSNWPLKTVFGLLKLFSGPPLESRRRIYDPARFAGRD